MKKTSSMIYRETDESRELYLYADNIGSLWTHSITPVIESLKKKVVKGIYDSEKAIEALYPVMTLASNLYYKDFGYKFSVGDRWTAATDMKDYIEEEYLNIQAR